jgi:predicted RNase H-like HicB family nuclease
MRTKTKEWSEGILEAINSLGNEASLQEIYGTLKEHFSLDQAYLRPTRHGGRPAYQHEVRSLVSNLVEDGYLERVGRARYRLTGSGLTRLEAWMQAAGRSLHNGADAHEATSNRRYLVEVEIEPLEDGRFLATATNLPGAHAEGDTIGQALENLEDVSRVTIELCREKHLQLPTLFEADTEAPLIRAEVLVELEA